MKYQMEATSFMKINGYFGASRNIQNENLLLLPVVCLVVLSVKKECYTSQLQLSNTNPYRNTVSVSDNGPHVLYDTVGIPRENILKVDGTYFPMVNG